MEEKCFRCENKQLCYQHVPLCEDVKKKSDNYKIFTLEKTLEYLLEEYNKISDKKLSKVKAIGIAIEKIFKKEDK